MAKQPPRWLPNGYPNYESLLAAAVDAAVTEPEAPKDLGQWRWGTFAPIDIEHPVLNRLPLIGRLTGPGLHEQSGGSLTIKQVGCTFGPSERYTADLVDLDQSTLNTVTGQGGNFLSPLLHGPVGRMVRRHDVFTAVYEAGSGEDGGASVGVGEVGRSQVTGIGRPASFVVLSISSAIR